MADELKEKKFSTWITFIGIILLLIGIYAGVRTGVNLVFFKKYPTEGVIVLPGIQPAFYPSREQDCTYLQIYYGLDGRTTRPATPEEKQNEAVTQKNCLDGIWESRDKAKINDISQSLLFLFLGVGVLVSRRIFFK